MTEKKTLEQMTAEIREVNTAKGWREPGKTYGDFIALLHSEVAEALEAFRAAGLEDLTGKIQTASDGVGLEDQPVKPEGVGAELGDVLIRFLDACDVIGVPMRDTGRKSSPDFVPTLDDIPSVDLQTALRRKQAPGPLVSFGDHMAWLDSCINQMWMDPSDAEYVLGAIMTIARKYGFDMYAEYERKQAFNATRDYRHGGKRL